MLGLGTTELIAIVIIIFVFFGAKRLPQLGGSIAKSIKNFKKEMNDEDSKLEDKSDKES